MSKVVAINGHTVPGEPNSDIIDELERLLDQARSGDLDAIAYCTVRKGCAGTGWVGGSGMRYPIGAAVMMLHHRYGEALLGETE